MALSNDEQKRLYETTVRTRLFDIAGPHPIYPFATMNARVRADRALTLFVRCGATVRQFSWYPERAPRNPPSGSEWARLLDVMRDVQRVLVARREYRGLPALPPTVDDPLREIAQLPLRR